MIPCPRGTPETSSGNMLPRQSLRFGDVELGCPRIREDHEFGGYILKSNTRMAAVLAILTAAVALALGAAGPAQALACAPGYVLAVAGNGTNVPADPVPAGNGFAKAAQSQPVRGFVPRENRVAAGVPFNALTAEATPGSRPCTPWVGDAQHSGLPIGDIGRMKDHSP